LREVLLSPNAIRAVSVAVFFVVWEYYGRRMDPIFMAPPSAIFQAALELIQSGALEKALIQTLWPFAVGMALIVVIGVAWASSWRSGARWNMCSTPSSTRSTPSRASPSSR
jgi:ABC-type nitrate/sulfonate/bicarbonate transport system permease component